MKVWKRNAVVAAVVLFVCAAVYLNWTYQSGETADAGKTLGESTLVGKEDPLLNGTSGSSSSGAEGGSQTEGETQSEAGASQTGETSSDYFSTARLNRQQARDSAISLLQEAAEQENADAAVANEASEGIQVLAGYTMKEAQIENLVTAKGYTDCVAFMGEDSISVVVDTGTGELTAEDVAKITDIAMTETGYPASGIKIMASN